MLDRGQEFVGVETNRLCERADVGARVDAGGEPLELAGIDQPKHGGADAGPLRDVAQLQAGGEPCLLQRAWRSSVLPSSRASYVVALGSITATGGEPAPGLRPVHYAPLLTSAEAGIRPRRRLDRFQFVPPKGLAQTRLTANPLTFAAGRRI